MKTMLKRFLSVLLAVCMSAGFVPVTSVYAKSYSGTHGTGTVYANSGNVINRVAAQMQKRRRKIIVYYKGSPSSFDRNYCALFYISTPTSYQYTLDTIDDIDYDVDYSNHKKGWDKYILTPKYKLSDSQEAATQRKVHAILRRLHLRGSAYQRALKINDYVARHMRYSWTPCTAYDALIKGRGNCQAYSEAFYLLALNSGIKAKMVQGDAYGDGSWGYHQWNFFRSGGKWYSIDVCWNDGYHDHTWVRRGLYMRDHKTGSKWVRMVRKS